MGGPEGRRIHGRTSLWNSVTESNPGGFPVPLLQYGKNQMKGTRARRFTSHVLHSSEDLRDACKADY